MNETEQTRYSMRWSIQIDGNWHAYVCHGMKIQNIAKEIKMKENDNEWKIISVTIDPNWKAREEAASNYMQTFGTECE